MIVRRIDIEPCRTNAVCWPSGETDVVCVRGRNPFSSVHPLLATISGTTRMTATNLPMDSFIGASLQTWTGSRQANVLRFSGEHRGSEATKVIVRCNSWLVGATYEHWRIIQDRSKRRAARSSFRIQ